MSELSTLDEQYLRQAIELAAHGLYTTDPNPRVGCVLVRDGVVVGEGWHERAGGPHAEVYALRNAGEAARGSTAYVSLEPCSHVGRTPPCALALIEAGVTRVVYAVGDPNPRVNGMGAEVLRAAGIEVLADAMPREAIALNPGFFKRMKEGLPWVRAKLAASLDGRTALANGVSRWITSDAARLDVQRYRARSSAVLTGSGTVRADDPSLNVRLPGMTRQPWRVVLDSGLRVSPAAHLFSLEGQSLVFTASDDEARRAALVQRRVRVESVPSAEGGLQLEAVLQHLALLQMNEIWVEAGARLTGALLRAGLVDELIVYVAPMLLGPDARPLIDLPALTELAQAQRFCFTDMTRVGEDLRLTLLPLR